MVFQQRPMKAKFRRALHFRLGVHINKETESVSFCLAVTRPVFGWSYTSILTILLRPGSLTWIRCVIGPVTFGTFGCEALPWGSSMVIASKDLISRKKAIASTHTSCFWIRMQGLLLASRIGIFQPPEATIPPAD